MGAQQCGCAQQPQVDRVLSTQDLEEPQKTELPDDGRCLRSAEEIVDAVADAGVTGTLDLGSNQGSEDKTEGLLRRNKLPVLKEVPSSVYLKCRTITTLAISGNQIRSLAGLSALPCLEVLDVSENHLEALPDEVSALALTLRVIDVSDNRLSKLPPGIGACLGLETLLAFKNELVALPDEIGQCIALQEANFFNNKITELPESFSMCEALEVLNVGNNKLQELPSIEKWVNMRDFKVHQNGLRFKLGVPSLSPMKNLECIKIDQCKALQELPLFGEHLSMELFDLSRCMIAALPPSIVTWTALQTLNCSYNRIAVLPPLALPCLELLNVSTNEISVLPAEIGKCAALKTFFCHENNITEVPEAFVELVPCIMRLNFSGQRGSGLTMDTTLEALKAACEAKKGRFMGPVK